MNKNCIFKQLLKICLIPAFLSCDNKPAGEIVTLSELPAVNIPAEFYTAIEIKNWLAIGAFEFQPLLVDPAVTFSRKDLKRYGIKEGSIDEAALKKLQRRGVNVFLTDVISPQIRLFNYVSEEEDISKKSNFYLVARIHSACTQDVTLIADGSYSYAVWLNGEQQIEVKGKYNTNKAGDRFVNVSLKEGENILFVKVNRGTNKRSWDFICAIAPRREAERIFRVNYASDFVVNPLINNSFEVYAGPYTSGHVEILDSKGQTLAGASFDSTDTNDKPVVVSGLKQLEEGFYKTILTVGDEKLEEMVYKGDYQQFVKKIKTKVNEIDDNSQYSKDLKVAMQRVEYLNNKPGDPKSPNETRFINRNRVFWGYSLYRMLQRDARTNLMTYNIDFQDVNWGVFVFHLGNKQRKNTPLLIIVPSVLQGNSMIEDWYTSNLDQIETDNALADQYGFAVAWIYAGGEKYSTNQTEQEIAAIIDRLSAEHDIDTQKIFITGDCEGGRRALLQLAATPGRYAACAVSAPLMEGIYANHLSAISEIPILISHGTNDDVSPIENSRKLYDKAQSLNMAVEYVETEGSHVSISKDVRRYVFEFISRVAF